MLLLFWWPHMSTASHHIALETFEIPVAFCPESLGSVSACFYETLCISTSPGYKIGWPTFELAKKSAVPAELSWDHREFSWRFSGHQYLWRLRWHLSTKRHAVASQLAKTAGPISISVGAYMHQPATESSVFSTLKVRKTKFCLAIC